MKKKIIMRKKCPHIRTVKEYICGGDSGDRICCDCGEVILYQNFKNDNSFKKK